MVKKLATNFHNWTMGVYDEQLVGAQNQQLVESGLSYAKNIVSDNRGSLYPRQGTKPLMRLAGESVLIPYTVLGQKEFLIVGHNGIKVMSYENKNLIEPITVSNNVATPTFTSTKVGDYYQTADNKFGFYCSLNMPYQQGNYTDPFSLPSSSFSFNRLYDGDRYWYNAWNVYANKTGIVYIENDVERTTDINLYIRQDDSLAFNVVGLRINSVQGTLADGTQENIEFSVTSDSYPKGVIYHIKPVKASYLKFAVSFTILAPNLDDYKRWNHDVNKYVYDLFPYKSLSVAIGFWLDNITEYLGVSTTFLPLSYNGDLTKLKYAQNYTDMILVGDSDFAPQEITLSGLTLSIAAFTPTGLSFATTGNPTAIEMYQNRIVLSGFSERSYEQMVALSEFSNAKQASKNFTVPGTPTATSALELYQNKMRFRISQLYSGDKALYVLSADGLSYINEVGTSGSPTFKIRNHEHAGFVKPIIKDDVLIYTDNTREKIYMVDYDLLVERYKVFDISAISKNLMSKKIKEMFYLSNRDRLIYILFDDGTMSAFLFDNNLNIRGFYPIETNGRVFDVCVHPDANELFLVVERANNYYVEVIEERPFIDYDHKGNEEYQKEFLTWMGNNTRFFDFVSQDMWRSRVISEDGLFFQYNRDQESLIPSDITEINDYGLVTDLTIDDTFDCGLVTDSTISDTSDNGTIGEVITAYSAIVSNCSNTLFNALEIGETYLFFDGQTPDKTKGSELTLLDKLWALDGTTAIFMFNENLDDSFYYPACIKKESSLTNQPQLLYWDGTSATTSIEDIMGTTDLVLSYQVILDGMYIGDYNCSYEAGTPFINHPDFEGYFHRIGLKYEKHAKMSYVAPMVDQKIISEMSIYLLNTQDIDVGVNGGFQSVTKFCTDGYYDYPNRLYQGEYSLVVDNNTEARKDVEIKTEQPFGFEVLAITAVTDYGDFGGN